MSDALTSGRAAYDRRAWAEAYELLTRADREAPLAVEDLERMGTAAYLIGREDDFLAAFDRAHRAHVDAGRAAPAARCGFWLGLVLLFRGEAARATGWFSRARRLIEDLDCVEQGWLLLPAAEQHLRARQSEPARDVAAQAAALGDRFSDRDLIACARHVEGRALLQAGRAAPGLALLDETMVAVTGGELAPIVTGLVYCSVIDACQQCHALDRAREWTAALADWCARQPELIAFTGACLVHRAEILQMSGEWLEAIEEARRACARAKPPAAAFYQQGELHRLRGELAQAEAAYRNASQAGCEPQPGLSLLWLAQGRATEAAAAIRRVLEATTERGRRARLLPASVEILLAADEVEAARRYGGELNDLAREADSDVLRATAAHAEGAIALAEGDAKRAVAVLRAAWQGWSALAVPYQAARSRALMGLACRALDDAAGGKIELDAARAVFVELGARPDVARLDALVSTGQGPQPDGLTPRELEVLRQVATGKTNKAIAAALKLSEKTIDRHVSNIFNKLNVATRAAATAYAYEHKLI